MLIQDIHLQPEKGEIWNWFCTKESLKLLRRGVLGAYLFIFFAFTCQHDQAVGCVLAD